MPRRKAVKGPVPEKPKVAKKRAKPSATVVLPVVTAPPPPQPAAGRSNSAIPWKQQVSRYIQPRIKLTLFPPILHTSPFYPPQLTALVSNLPPPLSTAATPASWTPESMAASLAAYADWSAAIRKWHADLESTLLEPNLDKLLDMISTPLAPPLTLAEAYLSPNPLHAYLVNEVTPNYRRFRALARPSEDHPALESLGAALDDMLAQHVLPHIAPGASADVASASFLQFVVHELLPSWVRFRERNADSVSRAQGGDEVHSAVHIRLNTNPLTALEWIL
ncbi:hypothetical protein CspeluHIS016_0902140 [Cutaneotrichosporon spelunceum]|uniref:Uncharacterized protein n=1 Tax=Cutaneotrichosporon spelunceum TaxID=1672016 RepID=A0AAD3U0U2_9TREE|nr:hypothetical protein CspeluHIS016_0902140 [Cutaneotrichosporon spelunceum]